MPGRLNGTLDKIDHLNLNENFGRSPQTDHGNLTPGPLSAYDKLRRAGRPSNREPNREDRNSIWRFER